MGVFTLDERIIDYLSSRDIESVELGISLFNEMYDDTYKTLIAYEVKTWILQPKTDPSSRYIRAHNVLHICSNFNLYHNTKIALNNYVKYGIIPKANRGTNDLFGY